MNIEAYNDLLRVIEKKANADKKAAALGYLQQNYSFKEGDVIRDTHGAGKVETLQLIYGEMIAGSVHIPKVLYEVAVLDANSEMVEPHRTRMMVSHELFKTGLK